MSTSTHPQGTPDVAVIICTRNRAEHLAEMLPSLINLYIPDGLNVDAIVVDNGSTDATQDIIAEMTRSCGWVRTIIEEKPGLSNARNAGIEATTAPIVLFTDDDVRIPTDWLSGMYQMFVNPDVHIIQGHIVLAESILLPWMEWVHRAGLAEFTGNEATTVVGANFGFRRSAWERVGGFDPRFGSGTAIGFGDDTLFGLQVLRLFGDIAIYSGAPIVHYPDTSRLTRESLLKRTRLGAISELWIAAALGEPIPHQATRPALINRLIFAAKALRSRLLHNGSPLTQDELYGYYSLVMSLEAGAYEEAKVELGIAA
ncbi:MAG: glycosyltransferase family 2 protein [Armatimonadaceae bacterium]